MQSQNLEKLEMEQTLGICILNWNGGTVLLSCIERLEAARKDLRSHLVIVDNASSDDSMLQLRRAFLGATVIQNNENLGYAAGNNVGAKHLLGLGCTLLLFVNPDVSLSGEALKVLLETLIANPNAGCAGGAPVHPSGEAAVVARTRPSAFQKIVAYGPLRRIPVFKQTCRKHWMFPEDLSDGATVYAVCGACIAFRTEAFREIGGFDEKTFLFEEEFIIAERLLMKGWITVATTSAQYVHLEGLSIGRKPYERRLHFFRSENYLLHEYYGWHRAVCFLLRVYRFAELGAFCLYWPLARAKRRKNLLRLAESLVRSAM